jgi:hypothetical protein
MNRPPVIQSPPLKELLKTVEWLDFLKPNVSMICAYARDAAATEKEYSGETTIPRNADFDTRFELPGWLPPAVKERVCGIYADVCDDDGSANQIDLLMRLARDLRMQNVWAELYKKKRSPEYNIDKFVHSPFFWDIGVRKAWRLKMAGFRRPPDGSPEEIEELLENIARSLIAIPKEPTNPYERQDLAIQYFFHHVYVTALVDSPVLTRAEVKNTHAERKSSARRLRTESKKLRAWGMKVEARELMRIAIQCEKEINFMYNRWIVDRQRSDNRLRGYLLTLAELNKLLFGTPMYGTLATIANVVFNRTKGSEITGSQVHEMLRGLKPWIVTSGRSLEVSMGFTGRRAAL